MRKPDHSLRDGESLVNRVLDERRKRVVTRRDFARDIAQTAATSPRGRSPVRAGMPIVVIIASALAASTAIAGIAHFVRAAQHRSVAQQPVCLECEPLTPMNSASENQNMRYNIAACAALAGSAAFAACTESPNAARAAVRDSAGVQIVDNPGDLWNTRSVWQLSTEPALRIGTVGGDTIYEFDGIEGIAELSDGRVVVTDEGTNAARWFDAQGKFLMRRGRAGLGPGEFEEVRRVTRLHGDSIVIVDGSQHRLVLFGKNGALGPIIQITGLSALPSVAYRLASGPWILGSSGITSHVPGESTPAGITRPMAPILRVASDGSRMDTLGMFPSREMEVLAASGRWRPARLAKRMVYSVFGNEVFVGTQDRLGFDVYSGNGKLLRSVRSPEVSNVLDAEYLSNYKKFLRAPYADSSQARRAEVERSIAEMVLSPTVPAYSSLLTDDSGNVWLGEFVLDGEPRRYVVFDSAGRFSSTVVMPERFLPITIARDRVWGRAMDSLNVEYVAAYRIVR